MYFFSFIYNMLKCQKEEKGFCKTQKYELQLLPAACCFHKNELEIFREDWPRRPPATVIYFFTSFPFFVSSIFQFLCRQLTHTAGNTSRSVFACCQNSTLSLFFRFEAFSFFRKSPRFLPASAGRILPASFLSIHKPELRVPDCRPHASRTFFFQSILSLSLAITPSSGANRPYPHATSHSYPFTNQNLALRLAGHTLPAFFHLKQSQPCIIYHAFFRRQPAVISPASFLSHKSHFTYIRLRRPVPHHQHQTNYTLPTDALRHLPMPPGYLLSPPLCRSLPLLQYPIFSFFFLPPFFFFSFFSFFFPLFLFFLLFIIFSLHFLFSRLFLFAFFISFSFLFFLSHHPARFLCAPAQRM